jgi:hypothetical protein
LKKLDRTADIVHGLASSQPHKTRESALKDLKAELDLIEQVTSKEVLM